MVSTVSGIRLAGASAINPFLYLRRFDHLVFDEFHTIDDRSFGLACLFSLLAVEERQGKVSLLSATPIDVTRVLERTGVRRDDIEMISEEVVDGHPPGHRPIHGNVEISLRDCSLRDSLALSIEDVRASIGADRTVIVVYDSLERLKRDEPEIRKLLYARMPDLRVMAINSIDDSEQKLGEGWRGRRFEDPRNYDLLLCTSSVEIGVTFRSTLMFMEPGHALTSFVQRVGRVSRGADDGQVIVSLSPQRRDRNPWMRRLAGILEQHDELDVQAFISEILRNVKRCLEPTPKEVEAEPEVDGATVPFYRRASWRGAFWAALFIVALRHTKMKVQKEARARLTKIGPGIVKFVEGKISEILSVDVVNDNLPRKSQPHRRWVNALFASALTYRDIGATVVVVDPDGRRHTVRELFLRRATNVPLVFTEEDGTRVIRLLSRTLDEEIRRSSVKQEEPRLTLCVPSPIGENPLRIRVRERNTEQLHRRLVEEWREGFSAVIPQPGMSLLTDPRKKVMGTATTLVERLGRPPLSEDHDDSEESALFA